MEEDLKILESYIKDFDKRNKYCVAFREDLLKIAIEHLIQAYKEQQAELDKYENLYSMALDNTIKSDKENQKKDKIINAMADCIAFGGSIYEGEPEKVKQYFERKVNSNDK